MAAGKRRLFDMFRMSRKLVLFSGGFLLLLGASGAAALMFAPAGLISGGKKDGGGQCKTLYQTQFRFKAERRLVSIIATDDGNPLSRVRIGMRIARHLAKTNPSDLITVRVADYYGPTNRVDLRGDAIGAEVVYAPNPSKTMAVSKPWEVRYVDAEPSALGLYFGIRKDVSLLDLEKFNHDMKTIEGCNGDAVDEKPKTVSTKGNGAETTSHGEAVPDAKPAGGH